MRVLSNEEKIVKRLITSAMASMLFSAAGFAQDSSRIPGPTSPALDPAPKLSFQTLDRNRDGKLTPDEARANTSVAAKFAVADKNGDGSLSAAEFNAYFNKPND